MEAEAGQLLSAYHSTVGPGSIRHSTRNLFLLLSGKVGLIRMGFHLYYYRKLQGWLFYSQMTPT